MSKHVQWLSGSGKNIYAKQGILIYAKGWVLESNYCHRGRKYDLNKEGSDVERNQEAD